MVVVQVRFTKSTQCVFVHAIYEFFVYFRLVFTLAFISLKNSYLQWFLRTFKGLSLLEQREYPRSKILYYLHCLFYSYITLSFSEKRRYGVRPLFTFIKQFDWKYLFSDEVRKSYLSINFPKENHQTNKHFQRRNFLLDRILLPKYFIHIRGSWEEDVLGLTMTAKL